MVRGRANPTLLLQVRAVKGAVFARVNVCKAHQRTESCWMKRRLNGEDLHLASRTSLYQNCAFFPAILVVKCFLVGLIRYCTFIGCTKCR